MRAFDKLIYLLEGNIVVASDTADVVELEYENRGSDLAILSGEGYVLKILRNGTWELANS